MVELTKKGLEDFPKEERKMFAFLSLHGIQNIVGSASFDEFLYASDFDLFEYKEFKDTDEVYQLIYEKFRDKFNKAYTQKDIYITDFKCGVLPGDVPIRWNREDMNNGYKYIEDRKYTFVECLQMKSRIKLDIIANIDNEYKEFSEIYFITIGNKPENFSQEEMIKTNLITALKREVNAKAKNGNYFKALKRLFSWFKNIGKEKYKQELADLLIFFNSGVGKLASYQNSIEIIIQVLNNTFKKVREKQLIRNLKKLREFVPDFLKKKVDIVIGMKSNAERVEFLKEMNNLINDKVQQQSKMFIKENNKISRYINIE